VTTEVGIPPDRTEAVGFQAICLRTLFIRD
jgi:hypothetical protein